MKENETINLGKLYSQVNLIDTQCKTLGLHESKIQELGIWTVNKDMSKLLPINFDLEISKVKSDHYKDGAWCIILEMKELIKPMNLGILGKKFAEIKKAGNLMNLTDSKLGKFHIYEITLQGILQKINFSVELRKVKKDGTFVGGNAIIFERKSETGKLIKIN